MGEWGEVGQRRQIDNHSIPTPPALKTWRRPRHKVFVARAPFCILLESYSTFPDPLTAQTFVVLFAKDV